MSETPSGEIQTEKDQSLPLTLNNRLRLGVLIEEVLELIGDPMYILRPGNYHLRAFGETPVQIDVRMVTLDEETNAEVHKMGIYFNNSDGSIQTSFLVEFNTTPAPDSHLDIDSLVVYSEATSDVAIIIVALLEILEEHDPNNDVKAATQRTVERVCRVVSPL